MDSKDIDNNIKKSIYIAQSVLHTTLMALYQANSLVQARDSEYIKDGTPQQAQYKRIAELAKKAESLQDEIFGYHKQLDQE